LSAPRATGQPRLREVLASPKMLAILLLGAASGFPNQITESALQAWLKDAGATNTTIGVMSYVALPYLLKFLWAPFIDRYPLPLLGRRRGWMLAMQAALAAAIALFALQSPGVSLAPIAACAVAIVFFSATQDIAADGVYISAMSHREQAAYVGVQGVFWNLGRIIATGLLVSLTGILHGRLRLDWARAWMLVLGALAMVMGISWMWHLKVLPSGGRAASTARGLGDAVRTFRSAFATFFAKKMIWRMIAVAYFYRFGEGLIGIVGPVKQVRKLTVRFGETGHQARRFRECVERFVESTLPAQNGSEDKV